ncbi:hypothetical protein [Streptomyces sp. A0642]|nr:hypothetical protein [Streptomyces sp. A0642]
MALLTSLRNVGHRLTKRVAGRESAWARQLLPPGSTSSSRPLTRSS